jgi:hypothetical protein
MSVAGGGCYPCAADSGVLLIIAMVLCCILQASWLMLRAWLP